MTTFSSTGRPAWAVTMWADDNFVYMELPVKDGPPYITKHSYSEGALGKALGMMRDIHRKMNPPGGDFVIPKHPRIKASPVGTAEQRQKAHEILKKMKII